MSCNNNNNDSEDIFEMGDLDDNIGRVITVFTQSGGASGTCGFTGLLVDVNCRFIKLITSVPSGPQHPFGASNGFFGGCGCNTSRFGTVIIIPRNKIVSYVFNEV